MSSTCSDCGVNIRVGNKSGRCRACYDAARQPPSRTCHECGVPVTQGSSRRCRPCAQHWVANNPEFIQKRADAVRKRFEDPAYRAKMIMVLREGSSRARQRPDYMEWLKSRGLELAALMNTPEVQARRMAKKGEWGKKSTERALGWCPEEYRPAYRRLIAKKVPAAEARKMMIEQIAADLARLSPFERQMRALENGASLTTKTDEARGYDFTLGGVTDWAA